MNTLLMLLGVILLDIILSGDNAVVVATVANQLPQEQRNTAINFGMAGAALLRIVFLVFATVLLQFRWISILAGLVLIYIAVKLGLDILKKNAQGKENLPPAKADLWVAVTSILVADASMSFDNVMAVAGLAHGHLVAMVLGVAFSIYLLTKAAKWVTGVLEKHPWLNWAGVGLILAASFNLLGW